MELSFIIIIVLFLLAVFLIIKLVKKVLMAVLFIVLLMIIGIAVVGGLVYSDYNYYSNLEGASVDIVYLKDGDYFLGVNVPFENGDINTDSLESLDEAYLQAIDVESYGEDKILIVVSENYFEESAVNNFSLDSGEITLDLSNFGLSGDDYDLSLTQQEYLQVVNSEDGAVTLADILLEKNNVGGLEASVAKPLIITKINEEVEKMGVSLNEALFLYSTTQAFSEPEKAIGFVEAFKKDEVEIYPERFSLKLAKMIPTQTIADTIAGNEEE
ncbi:MAG: hypothetical protein ACOCXG_04560 [Nanoarchaeota archaeon]